MIQFDVLFNDLGEIGVAQIIVVLMLSYFCIPSGINGLATVFIAYEPSWRCNVPPLDSSTAYPNLSENEILNLTTPYDSATGEYNGCSRYGYNLSECQDNLDCVNKSCTPIPCDMGYHYDRSLFTETVITEVNFGCSKRQRYSLLQYCHRKRI